MENKLHQKGVPKDLTFHVLERITNGFSEEYKIGSGGFGEVYKGVLDDGREVAVKKLYHHPGQDEVQFNNELSNLTRVQHQNIVELVGYCYEIRHKQVEHNGLLVFAKIEERALCFEYLPGGSLDKHLSDHESCRLEWHSCYKIIKGICEGLNYLHGGLEKPVFHLDLKPANILLDENMVPKIADFGLSRFFGNKHTHTTRNIIGTQYYMPPEYLSKRQISNKHDVFSLGLIIIEIMTGRKGYSNCADMSPEQFIELVIENWRNRIETTSVRASSHEIGCRQVKKCIKIALTCVAVDKRNRPTIADIINNLTEMETMAMVHEVPFFVDSSNMSLERKMLLSEEGTSNQVAMLEKSGADEGMAGLAKIGHWGGNGGDTYDIEVAPNRLESMTIYSGCVVDSLSFSYSDHNGHRHTIGPWGGLCGCPYKIQFNPSEFLVEVSGAIGQFEKSRSNVLTSLVLVTNEDRYSFGDGGGIPFSVPMKSNCSIVGFFGRAGTYLHAIGIYVNPNHLTLAVNKGMIWNGKEVKPDLQTTMKGGVKEKVGLAKIGPWGASGGGAHDIEVAPYRLESVTICNDVVIDSLAFSYSEIDGKTHAIGPWGGPGGNKYTIPLGPSEFLVRVSGTVGPFHSLPSVVTSLTFFTNVRTYGPFGKGGGTPFDVPMQSNGKIVAFFGDAGSCVQAIGVYIRTY